MTGYSPEPDVVDAWVRALAVRDADRLASLLGAGIRLRALLPAGLVELNGRDAVLAEFDRWFDGLDSVEVTALASEAFSDRVLSRYGFRLGKGERAWVVAQSAVCTTAGGRLEAIDLVCTGFRPQSDRRRDYV